MTRPLPLLIVAAFLVALPASAAAECRSDYPVPAAGGATYTYAVTHGSSMGNSQGRSNGTVYFISKVSSAGTQSVSYCVDELDGKIHYRSTNGGTPAKSTAGFTTLGAVNQQIVSEAAAAMRADPNNPNGAAAADTLIESAQEGGPSADSVQWSAGHKASGDCADGSLDAWKGVKYGLDTSADADADGVPDYRQPDLDADGDGRTNGQEAADGTDPYNPASRKGVPNEDDDADGFTNSEEDAAGTDSDDPASKPAVDASDPRWEPPSTGDARFDGAKGRIIEKLRAFGIDPRDLFAGRNVISLSHSLDCLGFFTIPIGIQFPPATAAAGTSAPNAALDVALGAIRACSTVWAYLTFMGAVWTTLRQY